MKYIRLCFLVYFGLLRHNRQVIAFVVGDRSKESCRRLWKRIVYFYRGKRSFSDFWESYKHIFDLKFHKCIGKETGETNHVERLFCTIRQWLQRMSRKTLAFSKVLYMHHVIMKVFFMEYNEYVTTET
jgi:IS1 family transposase